MSSANAKGRSQAAQVNLSSARIPRSSQPAVARRHVPVRAGPWSHLWSEQRYRVETGGWKHWTDYFYIYDEYWCLEWTIMKVFNTCFWINLNGGFSCFFRAKSYGDAHWPQAQIQRLVCFWDSARDGSGVASRPCRTVQFEDAVMNSCLSRAFPSLAHRREFVHRCCSIQFR